MLMLKSNKNLGELLKLFAVRKKAIRKGTDRRNGKMDQRKGRDGYCSCYSKLIG